MSPITRRKLDLVLASALVAVVMLTWLPRMDGPIDLRWDGGVYYVLGTSIATGSGYRLLNEPGEIQATQYPPSLPGIIVSHMILGGRGRSFTRTFGFPEVELARDLWESIIADEAGEVEALRSNSPLPTLACADL